jgi:hypothetical protein
MSASSLAQQLQFLQLHGLQRQPPLVQLQVQAEALFSIFSMEVSLSSGPLIRLR